MHKGQELRSSVKHLPSKHVALSSNHNATKKKKKERKEKLSKTC
jgi:hypothetical protein